MKAYYDIAQGSAEWFQLRRGIPTSSMFHNIVTPVTGKLSKSADRYAYMLLAERLLNEPMESVSDQEWMERGKDLEPLAVKQYEWVNGVETVPVGFITTDDGLFGCSPDRLVQGAAVGVEIKCPAPHNHVRYLLEGTHAEYRPQVQGQLLIAELELVHLYSYHPRMPAALIKTPRDEPYIELLSDALDQFAERLAEMEALARSLGVFQAAAEARTPAEIERAGELRGELLDQYGIPP